MTSPMLDLRHLRALAAIRDRGNLTRAAADLGLSQSALSHLMAELERQVGVGLVDRRAKPPSFTAAGRRALALADAVLPQVAAAHEDLARIRDGSAGRLLLSLECHSCIEWLVPTLDAYRARHPAIDLDVRVGASFAPLPALRDGFVDLVITSERAAAPGVAADPLFRYQIVGVLPPRHALARRARLRPADFAAETVVTYPVALERLDLFSRFLDPAGIAPARRRTAELTAMIVQTVAGGHGIAALPQWAVAGAIAAGNIVARPLLDGLWTTLYALRRSGERATPHLDAFVDLARRTSLRLLDGVKPAAC